MLVLVYLSNLIGVILAPILTKKFNRKGIMLFSLMFFAISNSAIYLIPKEQTNLFFAALGTSLASVIIYTLLPDAVEYGEYQTGIRTEGAVYSLVSFATKIGSAIGGAVPAWILAATGYLPNAAQNPDTLTAIRALMTVIPGTILVVAFAALLFYAIDDKQFQFYMTENAKRRAAQGAKR